MPRHWLTVLILPLTVSTAAFAQSDRQQWAVHVDLNSVLPSTDYVSWLDGGVGKLRYDETYSGLGIGRLFVEYDGRIAPTLSAHVVGDWVEDGASGLDLTEAFLEWRPVPQSANRHRIKLGVFYPEISLENGGPGWGSAFSISSSAINTWIAEELKTIGAEWSMLRSIGPAGSGRHVKLLAALYYGNDPTGTLLSWKGWSLHDRQTRLNDVLPLPPLPQITPDGMFGTQAPQAEPFIETDDRPGFYYGAEWRFGRRALVAVMHYDNHADPMSLRRGQYGWIMRFDHVGTQVELPGDLGLIAQWMQGRTAMGPILGPARAVDVDFDSYFVLLTKRVQKHRLSLRYDDFDVVDRDQIPLDDNSETGDAWTLAYRYDHSERLFFNFEWLSVATRRASWAYFGLPTSGTERVLQMQLSLSLGSHGS